MLPSAGPERHRQLEALLAENPAARAVIRLVAGQSHAALEACDFTLIASGTATLEAALYKRPMAIAYKMSPTSYRLMKGMGYLPYVGLPNILAGKFVVPEFIQHDATPENLAQALLNFYTDKETCARIADVFHDIHLQLKQNTAERAANAILCMLPAGRLTEAAS